MLRNLSRIFHISRGNYIALCEGDDFWCLRDKLQLQVDYLTLRPNVGMVHTDYNKILKFGNHWRTYKAFKFRSDFHIPVGDVFQRLLEWFFITTCTVLVRRSLIDEFYHSKFANFEYPVGDVPLFLFIAKRSEIGYLPLPSAMYRQTPGSIMNSGMKAGLIRTRKSFLIYEDFFEEYNVNSLIRTQILARLADDLMSASVLAGDKIEFENGNKILKDHDLPAISRARRVISLLFLRFRPAFYLFEAYNKFGTMLYIILRFQKVKTINLY
jgi:hypothetical protein